MNTPRLLALVIACAAACGPSLVVEASAQTRAEIRKSVEGTMELTGTVDISAVGAVEALNLDHEEQIEPSIRNNVHKVVAGWRFEPVLKGGQAMSVRAPLNMRLLARQTDNGGATISIADASFHDYDVNDTAAVRRSSTLAPPEFPDRAIKLRASGVCTLILEIGRDGKPLNVAVEQVNLYVVLRPQDMERARDAFARASVGAAKRWQFAIPTTGDVASDASWTVRVPVRFAYADQRERYAQWQAYVPGPKFPAKWDYRGKGSEADKGNLLSEGGVYMAGVSKGPKLITPPGG